MVLTLMIAFQALSKKLLQPGIPVFKKVFIVVLFLAAASAPIKLINNIYIYNTTTPDIPFRQISTPLRKNINANTTCPLSIHNIHSACLSNDQIYSFGERMIKELQWITRILIFISSLSSRQTKVDYYLYTYSYQQTLKYRYRDHTLLHFTLASHQPLLFSYNLGVKLHH